MRPSHSLTGAASVHQMRAGGQYHKATLIERYGSTQNLVDLRLELGLARKSRPARSRTCTGVLWRSDRTRY